MTVAVVDQATVGHCTGVHDDSKIERVIFSGDIVSCRSCRADKTLMQKKLGIVEYDDHEAAFRLRTADRIVMLTTAMQEATLVVIGNKTDSPKLFNRINNGNNNY